MAQSDKCPTLGSGHDLVLVYDIGSGHDLVACEFQSHMWLCAEREEATWDSVAPSLCPFPARALSLKINKYA